MSLYTKEHKHQNSVLTVQRLKQKAKTNTSNITWLLCTKRRSNESNAPTESVCSKEAVTIQQSTGHSTVLGFLSFLRLCLPPRPQRFCDHPTSYEMNTGDSRIFTTEHKQLEREVVKHSPALVESLKRTLKFHLHNPTYVHLTE
jgi:hypothetical protein